MHGLSSDPRLGALFVGESAGWARKIQKPLVFFVNVRGHTFEPRSIGIASEGSSDMVTRTRLAIILAGILALAGRSYPQDATGDLTSLSVW